MYHNLNSFSKVNVIIKTFGSKKYSEGPCAPSGTPVTVEVRLSLDFSHYESNTTITGFQGVYLAHTGTIYNECVFIGPKLNCTETPHTFKWVEFTSPSTFCLAVWNGL